MDSSDFEKQITELWTNEIIWRCSKFPCQKVLSRKRRPNNGFLVQECVIIRIAIAKEWYLGTLNREGIT